MLESLFNKVAGPQDFCKTYLYCTLKILYFFRYLEPSRTSMMKFFLTLVKPYFKSILNLIELPSGSIFYTSHAFVKKLTSVKTMGEKVFC